MKAFLARFAEHQSAATSIEYGLIAALIAAVMVFSLSRVGPNLTGKFNVIARQLSDPSDTDDQTASISDFKRAQHAPARP